MLFWEGVLGQMRTITTTTTRKQQETNNNKKTTTWKQQQENNNKNNNTSSNTQKTTTTQTRTKQATTTKIKNKQTTGKDKNKTQKRTKNEPNCLQIAHGLKNRAEKRAHPPNAFTLQKQAFQKIKRQHFTKCTKKAFFSHTNILQIGICTIPLDNVTPKNTIFIRATPRQTEIALGCPVQKFRCVFPQNWALGPWGGQFLIFYLFFGCHIFPLKCLFLQCETRVDPEPALRWTPNRHVFWKNAVPKPTVRHKSDGVVDSSHFCLEQRERE